LGNPGVSFTPYQKLTERVSALGHHIALPQRSMRKLLMSVTGQVQADFGAQIKLVAGLLFSHELTFRP
jgi:hypothetical protein